jgi:hypothetical protein
VPRHADAFGGTFETTTDPAPIRALSPISTAPMSLAPAPTTTPLRSVGWRLARCMLVPPSVTPCRMWQSSPISAVSPITTPMPWSMNSPSPIVAPGWISMPVNSRLKLEITRGTTGTFRLCSAFARRCSSRAWKPGYASTTSSVPLAAGSRCLTASMSRLIDWMTDMRTMPPGIGSVVGWGWGGR